MPDNWLIFIPHDPDYVPATAAQIAARAVVEDLTPTADDVDAVVTEQIEFIHCGANLERITCPACAANVGFDWWESAMDHAMATGFVELDTPMPCCGKSVSLNDLGYDWPCGFARFRIEAMNPGIADIDQVIIAELEALTQTKLRRIWRHI